MSIKSISDWFIPSDLRADENNYARAKTVIGLSLLSAILTPLFAASYYKLGHYAMFYAILIAGILMISSALTLKVTGQLMIARELSLTCFFVLMAYLSYVSDGIRSSSLMWMVGIPMCAIFVGGRNSGIFWGVMALLAIITFFVMSKMGVVLPHNPIKPELLAQVQARSLLGLCVLILTLALLFESNKRSGYERLEQSRLAAETSARQVQELLESLTHSIRQASSETQSITQSASTMANHASAQRNLSQSVNQAIETFAGITQHNAEQTTDAANRANAAGLKASEGGALMQSTLRTLETVGQVVSDSAIKIEELGRRSNEVGSIVQVIQEIAAQTNLLALNAAIEAARAGEQGRGFAVVADEVRKLAERTQSATKEIEDKITAILDGTQQAISAMRDGNEQMQASTRNAANADDALKEIITNAQAVATIVGGVSAREQQQNQTVQTMVSNIEQLSSASASAAASSEAIVAAIANLDRLVADLDSLARRYAA